MPATLPDKITRLKLTAYHAARTADFWQRQLDQHGEVKATEFYRHLGLNHVELKGVEFEGLTLRRQPRPSEAVAVKGVAQAQDSARERLVQLLAQVRTTLIDEGLREVVKLKPATYHALVLDGAADYRNDLQRALMATYNGARLLVARELGGVPKGFTHEAACNDRFLKGEIDYCRCEYKADTEDFDELDDLLDLTLSRVTNDVQARITGAATRLATIGLSPANFTATLSSEILSGSVSYVDRISSALANRTINIGRGDEMEAHADEIERYEQSALLDNNVCGPCLEDDGLEADDPSELPGGPNPDCLGSDLCRCFVVAVRA